MLKRFRVYDYFERKWLNEGIYLSPFDIVTEAKGLFGYVKLGLGLDSRYIVHRNIEMVDKNERQIFEGDVCKADDGKFTGVVAYVPEECAYVLLDTIHNRWYPLGAMYQDRLEIVGNVIDNPNWSNDPKIVTQEVKYTCAISDQEDE